MRFFILISLAFLSFRSFASEYTWSTFQKQHVNPFAERAMDTTSLSLLASGIAAFYVTTPADNNIRSQYRGYQKMSKDDAQMGDLVGSGAAGALAIGAQYFFDRQQDHWVQHTRALVWGALITSVLKYPLNRQRPGDSDSHLSLPSGHTATIFTSATSLTYAYGWKAAVLAYPVAAFVGLSRLSDDVHWASDVVSGAFIGFIVGRASAYDTPEAAQLAARKYGTFFPVLVAGGSGLGWNYFY